MKLMTLDGNSVINRAFYGIRMLNASDGTPTNAIYGFLNILQKLISEEMPDALCVTFDFPAPTFRHEQYDQYKAHRRPMPDELRVQLPILKEVLEAMNIPSVEMSGWEADDLLGAIAKKCEAVDWECVIVTGDKDTLQLVSETTRVKLVKTSKGQTETINYTPSVFFDEYGFTPERMIDLKALMGDSSDNIPGVAGVGEKTAMELVQRFGGIEDIYATLDTIDIRDSVRNKLETGRDRAQLSHMLATIRVDAPVEIEPEEALCQEPSNDKLFAIFKRLGFSRMIIQYGLKQPGGGASQMEAVQSVSIIELRDKSDVESMLDAAKSAEIVAISLDLEYFDAIAVVMSGDNTAYIIKRGISEEFDKTFAMLMGEEIKKASHDIKDIIRTSNDCGIDTAGWIFDTALAAYLISPTDNKYELKRIAEKYSAYMFQYEDDEESGQMSLHSDNSNSLAQSAYAISLLVEPLTKTLNDMELFKLYNDVEIPLCYVLAKMEQKGFMVDKEALVEYGKTLSEGIEDAQQQIYNLGEETFNINSPKQLGVILFEKLMLPAPRKTKTGYSTNIEVLDSLSGKHPIIEYIKEYRELTKLKSTYIDGLLKEIKPSGRIHTHFQMTVTATGRLSSIEPNLQNIPVRKETGEEIRKMFVAQEGKMLIGADYSQIELRVLAHIAQDPVMLEAFHRGDDIHAVTASQVFGVPLENVTSEQRGRAKAVNFGIVYGISSFSLANDIGVLPREAKAYMDSYLDKYSGVREYMAMIVEIAKAQGFVSTLFGRIRYLPELKSSNFNTRSFGERVALNMPIQGTAADIIKIAMINVSKRIEKEGYKGCLILQVHDELIAECPEDEALGLSVVLREEMESAAQLLVPLVADTRIGKSWYDVK
ncbi:MAG: DNA polymerase I [Oscillospiraceae bacterium]|nr:DNA polymerase I [Oscillospiraceae bacterium]